jgi:hypothetical protein
MMSELVASEAESKTEMKKMKPNNGDVYEAAFLRRSTCTADLGSDGTALYRVLGVDQNSRGNLALIEDDVLIYVSGNATIFENVTRNTKDYLLYIDDGGVGCVAVHPSR